MSQTSTDNKTEAIEIARTIKHQIGVMTLMAVGGRDFLALPRNAEHRGGLIFTVNRTRLTKVTVRLAWNDTYTVEYHRVNPRTFAVKSIASREGVYCDQLAETVYDLTQR